MRELLELAGARVDPVGRALLDWVVRMNMACLLMLAAAMVADRLLAARVSARWRILLYTVVLARLAMPAGPLWQVPGWTLGMDVVRVDVVTVEGRDPRFPSAAGVRIGPAAPAWPGAMVAAYSAGVAVLAAAWLRDWRRLRRWTEEPGGEVVVAPDAGPMVVGVWRPRIVVPAWLTGEALARVLAHERAHVERRDPALAAAVRAACIAGWPVAAAWVAGSRVRGLMEQACDERAVRSRNGVDKEARMQYAKTMMDVAERAGAAGAVRGALGFGAGWGASLRSRIAALRPTRRWPLVAQAAAAVLIPAAVLACSSAGPAPAPPPPRPAATSAAEDQAKAEARRASSRLVNVRVLKGDARADGVVFSGAAGGAESVVGERSVLAGLMAPGSGATVLSAPQVMVLLGQEAVVSIGDGTQRLNLRVTVRPSPWGTTDLVLSYEEGDAGTPSHAVQSLQVSYAADNAIAVRVPGSPGQEPRILMVTVDQVPPAPPVKR